MALDLNDPDLELSDLLFAYQTWVLAVLNDEKLNPEGEKLATDEISEDAMNALRFLPAEVTSTVESTLAYQISRLATANAFCSINSRRGSTSSPISVENIWSARNASSMVTCNMRRASGSIVVSHNCSGFISPRPL